MEGGAVGALTHYDLRELQKGAMKMGLFTNILSRGIGKSKTSEAQSTAFLPGPKTFSIGVVGESHYQSALESICGGRTDQGHEKILEAVLLHEDNNPYDSKAIRVDIQKNTVVSEQRKCQAVQKEIRESWSQGDDGHMLCDGSERFGSRQWG